jgi:hypothetical protein
MPRTRNPRNQGEEAMKRAVVMMLVVSLSAMSLFAAERSPRLSNPRVLSLEHAQGAWRMQIKCEEGTGSIWLMDAANVQVYRGEGCFSTWSQERLSATYQSLLPIESRFELLQLG